MAGAIIFAAVITLLLQRVGNTPFLVSITINDFAGAILVGFLVQCVGIRILDFFVERKKSTKPPIGD